MLSKRSITSRLALSAMFLAMALFLPFLTGQIPQFGRALCPMHIPVLLCGFFCGPLFGFAVGFTAPLLRFFLFGMPAIMPTGIAMSLELATYGAVAAIFYRWLPKKKVCIYLSLLSAMLCGRIVWGIASAFLYGLNGTTFGWTAFFTGAVVNAVPGLIVQIILIPILVMALGKYTLQI